jgi:hypothetical protein
MDVSSFLLPTFFLILEPRLLVPLIKYNLDNPSMAIIYCKKCGEYRYPTPHVFWNMTDVGIMCEKCDSTNTITMEDGELRKQS